MDDSIPHEKDQPIEVNLYSLAAYYVEPFFDSQKLSCATCFFSRCDEKLFLVTNWHVVSGKDADTRELLSPKTGAVPNKLRIYLPQEDENGHLAFSQDSFFELSLFRPDGEKVWYEMERENGMIDVVVIPIDEEIHLFHLPIETAEEPFNENTKIEIGEEIFVVGFPFGQIGGPIPIWKRASVASEPDFDINDMPYFYADTATRKGMSGSPAIIYKKRSMTLVDKGEGKFSRHFTKLIGVYSGRIGTGSGTEGDAQLGRIWKADIIKTIIAANEK